MISERLKERRSYEGYTQQDIATMLNVGRATYAGWECGKDIIPLKRMYKIANHYRINLDYMLGITNHEEKMKYKKEFDINQVAKNLRKVRKNRKLTQTDVANILHTTQSNIHKYETGKCLITTMYAVQFAKNFDCSLDDIFDRKKNEIKKLITK